MIRSRITNQLSAYGDRAREMNDEPTSSSSVATDDAPTRQLVSAAAAGDRCASCGTPLSGDQRYCVNCGERRGKPRFSVASAAPAASDPPAAPPPRAPRASSGATVVAGVGTLLLAMGVGVLIGHNTASTPKQAAVAPTVVTVNGGAAAPTTTGAASAASTNAGGGKHGSKSTSKSKSGSKSKSKASAKPTAAQAAKASNAANKVLGSSNTNLPPATVTQGQTGTGPGYNKKTKKFDGSFFGQ